MTARQITRLIVTLIFSLGSASVTAGGTDCDEHSRYPESFEGIWESSYGHLFFTHRTSQGLLHSDASGKGIRAAFWAYSDSHGVTDNARIIGKVTGRVLEGHWVQDSGEHTCDYERDGSAHWGMVRFEANEDFTELRGVYGYCENPPEGDDADWILWRDEIKDWDPDKDG